MFYLYTIGIHLFFWLMVVLFAKYAKRKTTSILSICCVTAYLACLLYPPLLLQSVLIAVALCISQCSSYRCFTRTASFCTAIVIGWTFWLLNSRVVELEQLQHRYAYESLSDRLPEREVLDDVNHSDTGTWNDIEEQIETRHTLSYRTHELRRLHDNQTGNFILMAGFGVGRMPGPPSQRAIESKLREERSVPQPVFPSYIDKDDEPVETLPKMHVSGLLDFLNPAGFGYVKDREHVVGFIPHGFTELPPDTTTWQVGRVELIGLLLEREPRVYVTENLPRMDEVRNVPTRLLDAFELEGLENFRDGEDYKITESKTNARMLGSIRATQSCIDWHGGNKGDLLGAFTYQLHSR